MICTKDESENRNEIAHFHSTQTIAKLALQVSRDCF